jgi:CelD/BcsL family acetyltransferase involved in cellulose biosynthesis
VQAVMRVTPLTALDEAVPVTRAVPDATAQLSQRRDVSESLTIVIHRDLPGPETEWRRFEAYADCTAFQTFDWLDCWYRHIGTRARIRPVVAIGRFADGETAFLLPLGIAPGRFAKRLSWLGQELCDYNAPLLAPDFSRRVSPDGFLAVWAELLGLMRRDPFLRFDWIKFEKMPKMVGGQNNPLAELSVTTHASGAHLTQLGDDWDKFYASKRSSATRRRDRSKRAHLAALGQICLATATDAGEARQTLDILMEQKGVSLTRKGVGDIFARPGLREFYLELASSPRTREFVHVSRLDIGTVPAATNLGLVFRDCYYHILSSFIGGELSRYGTGALHLRELMAHAIARKLRRFDFTVGDEPYKLEWSDTDFNLYDYAEWVTWRGWPPQSLAAARGRIKRFIKQTPLIWDFVSRLRAAIGRRVEPIPGRPSTALRIGTALRAAAAGFLRRGGPQARD